MIGSLIGLIKEKTPSAILLEVNGIGYEISIPLSTSFQLPKVGESAFLLTHLVILFMDLPLRKKENYSEHL